jgi:hypothetical protein
VRPACQPSGKGGGAARIVLGLLYPRRLQKTYHAAGGECRNRACQVRSWSFEEAGWTWAQDEDWTVCTYVCICGGDLDGAARRLLAVTGDWSPVSSNKARGCCSRTLCRPSSSIAAGACSPALFTCMSVHREPAAGGPGSGWRQARRRFLCQLPGSMEGAAGLEVARVTYSVPSDLMSPLDHIGRYRGAARGGGVAAQCRTTQQPPPSGPRAAPHTCRCNQ